MSHVGTSAAKEISLALHSEFTSNPMAGGLTAEVTQRYLGTDRPEYGAIPYTMQLKLTDTARWPDLS